MERKIIDLRSDTVTKPNYPMRQFMANAEVGDDVLGDDPTVKKLEKLVAEMFGKEAALFVPSGTMANQLALRSQTEHGDEIIMDKTAHMYNYEGGAAAALSGVTCKLLSGERGIFDGNMIKEVLRPINDHFPRTRMVVIENTSNRGGGSIWPLEMIEDVNSICKERGLKMHLDGARIWNAMAETEIPANKYGRYFDSISVCFSKGLGAPIGSAVIGSSELISRARRFRKMYGGGMRQVGIIAAGAIFALKQNLKRIIEDNQNAKILAEGLNKFPFIELNPRDVQTNIVIFNTMNIEAEVLRSRLEKEGILCLTTSRFSIRMVTNLEVTREDIHKSLEILGKIV